jgi:predicted Zn-dependent peptidase
LPLIGVDFPCEKYSEAGSAHFIEHMLFKERGAHGRPAFPDQMDTWADNITPLRRGKIPALCQVLDSHLDLAIELLSEMFFESLFALPMWRAKEA